MNGAKLFSSFDDWLTHSLANDAGQKSIMTVHFDRFENFRNSRSTLESYKSFCRNFISSLFLQLNIDGIKINGYNVLIRISLGESDRIVYWNGGLIDKMHLEFEPPEITLLKSTDFFRNNDEEYRVPVSISEISDINAIYRCFRAKEDSINRNNFSKYLFISPNF